MPAFADAAADVVPAQIPLDAQEEAGLSPGYIRVSVGFTGALEQRWEQLHKALLDLKLIPGQ